MLFYFDPLGPSFIWGSRRQTITVESSLPVANIVLSGETLTERIRPRCPANLCSSLPVATSQT